MKEKKKVTVLTAVLSVLLLVGVTTAFATTAEEPPYQGTTEAVDVLPPAVAEPIPVERGKLVWPAEDCNVVSAPFGWENPVTGAKLDHITIAGSRGANVLAAAAGTVADAAFQSNRGNYVEIDHGNGLVTMYTHCDDVFVSIGSTVEQGEVIAAMGQSGSATGPCLGFYLANGNETVDPMEWFEK